MAAAAVPRQRSLQLCLTSQEYARIIRGPGPETRIASTRFLPTLLSLATLSRNYDHDTCGRLLGKAQNSKFVVTTLVVPKQHSINDTYNRSDAVRERYLQLGKCNDASTGSLAWTAATFRTWRVKGAMKVYLVHAHPQGKILEVQDAHEDVPRSINPLAQSANGHYQVCRKAFIALDLWATPKVTMS
ncbi:hypothetical protein BU15DRAFT_63398 [Melanogaster broomeanus]|nr:hypothetical protein BU15DRAFT_63398 [Melanogaster broomeanus]